MSSPSNAPKSAGPALGSTSPSLFGQAAPRNKTTSFAFGCGISARLCTPDSSPSPATGSIPSSTGRQTPVSSSSFTPSNNIPSGTETVRLSGVDKENPFNFSSRLPSPLPSARNTQSQPTTLPNTAAGQSPGASGDLFVFGSTSRAPASFTPSRGDGLFGRPLDTASIVSSAAPSAVSTSVFTTPIVATPGSASISFGKTAEGSPYLFGSADVSPSSNPTATETATAILPKSSVQPVQALPSGLSSKDPTSKTVRVPWVKGGRTYTIRVKLPPRSTTTSTATDSSSSPASAQSTKSQPSLFGSSAATASTSTVRQTPLVSTTLSTTSSSTKLPAQGAQNPELSFPAPVRSSESPTTSRTPVVSVTAPAVTSISSTSTSVRQKKSSSSVFGVRMQGFVYSSVQPDKKPSSLFGTPAGMSSFAALPKTLLFPTTSGAAVSTSTITTPAQSTQSSSSLFGSSAASATVSNTPKTSLFSSISAGAASTSSTAT